MILIVVLLAGCGKKAPNLAPEVDLAPQAHLFQMTPTVLDNKGDPNAAQAHAVSTMPGYPTPLPTYLVPSTLITLTSPTQLATVVNTPVNPTATTAATATQTQSTQVTPTSTSTPIPPTATSTTIASTATPVSQYVYAIQPGSPAFVPNFTNTSAGCNWQGIAGQVFNASGVPVSNLVIKAGGTWNGAAVNLLGMTGASTAYGEGGYELVLGSKAVNSTNTVWVQVYDLASKPLTDKVYLSTYADCTKNLTIANFKEIVDGISIYVPLVIQTAVP